MGEPHTETGMPLDQRNQRPLQPAYIKWLTQFETKLDEIGVLPGYPLRMEQQSSLHRRERPHIVHFGNDRGESVDLSLIIRHEVEVTRRWPASARSRGMAHQSLKGGVPGVSKVVHRRLADQPGRKLPNSVQPRSIGRFMHCAVQADHMIQRPVVLGSSEDGGICVCRGKRLSS